MGKVRISKYLSIQQAKQLKAAVPESDYGAIGEGVDVLRYGGVLDNGHPLAELGDQGRIDFLHAVAARIPGTPVAAHIARMAAQVAMLADRPEVSCLLAYYALCPVEDLWRETVDITGLDLEQAVRSHGHPHRLRMLQAANVPLWALEELQGMPAEALWAITPETVVDLAEVSELPGLGLDELIAQAAGTLRLLRVLSLLSAGSSHLIELLQLLDVGNDETDEVPASPIHDVQVSVRVCRPPGALALAEPRVPRAPGRVVPRRPAVEGRDRLRPRGGRLIA
ncbi:hypothetical protein [Streptomyces sp. EAG2]|uniref:hypothetical protein n=1 Tax=Streptomyces sp. EAG2 TaxID=2056495 RepID=UPI00117F27BB|nr:hypothetical protein [Streptomyces sp. EAG2]